MSIEFPTLTDALDQMMREGRVTPDLLNTIIKLLPNQQQDDILIARKENKPNQPDDLKKTEKSQKTDNRRKDNHLNKTEKPQKTGNRRKDDDLKKTGKPQKARHRKKDDNRIKHDDNRPRNASKLGKPTNVKQFLEQMLRKGKLTPEMLLEVLASESGNISMDNKDNYAGKTVLGAGTGIVLGGKLVDIAGGVTGDRRDKIADKLEKRYNPESKPDDNQPSQAPRPKFES